MNAPLISILILFSTGIIITSYEITRQSRISKYDFLFFVNAFFVLYFIVAPISSYFYGEAAINRHFSKEDINTSLAFTALHAPFFYISLLLGYKSAEHLISGKIKVRSALNYRFWEAIFIFTILLGIFSTLIYIKRYGGIDAILESSAQIRSGAIERDNIGAIAKQFSQLIVILYFIVLHMVISKQLKTRKTFYQPLVLVIFLSALFVQYLSSGRGAIIGLFIVPYFSYLHYYKKRPGLLAMGLGALTIGTVALAGPKIVIDIIQYNPNTDLSGINAPDLKKLFNSLLPKVVSEFTHPFLSIPVAINESSFTDGWRGFVDIPLGILFYLKAFGAPVIDTVTYVHTENVIGIRESILPPGIIAASIYSFGFLGVIIGGAMYGLFGGLINYLFNILATKLYWFLPVYIMTGLTYGGFLGNGDFRSVIMNFSLIAILLFTLSACKWRFINKKSQLL